MAFNFERLDVWQICLKFAEKVYDITKDFPPEERYGLTSQFRRAAVSVASNVAEGKGRHSKREFRNFLFMARGSLYEAITHSRLSSRFGYLNEGESREIDSMAFNLMGKLSGLVRSLDPKSVPEPRAPSPEQEAL